MLEYQLDTARKTLSHSAQDLGRAQHHGCMHIVAAGVHKAAAQRVEQYLGCDLMILDDLGTEMITAYSTSALYTLINTRLTRAKATIISTNCSNEELQKKYTPQILSRIDLSCDPYLQQEKGFRPEKGSKLIWRAGKSW